MVRLISEPFLLRVQVGRGRALGAVGAVEWGFGSFSSPIRASGRCGCVCSAGQSTGRHGRLSRSIFTVARRKTAASCQRTLCTTESGEGEVFTMASDGRGSMVSRP